MERIRYDVVSTKKVFDGAKQVTVYGIAANTVLANGELCTVLSLDDISPKRDFVNEIAEKLNRLNVSPVHFKNIIEDIVARQLPYAAN